jgi:hypothetical protein
MFAANEFAARCPARGQPAAAPRRLALGTLLPYVEALSDRRAAAAGRRRIAWQDARSVALTAPGFARPGRREVRTR